MGAKYGARKWVNPGLRYAHRTRGDFRDVATLAVLKRSATEELRVTVAEVDETYRMVSLRVWECHTNLSTGVESWSPSPKKGLTLKIERLDEVIAALEAARGYHPMVRDGLKVAADPPARPVPDAPAAARADSSPEALRRVAERIDARTAAGVVGTAGRSSLPDPDPTHRDVPPWVG